VIKPDVDLPDIPKPVFAVFREQPVETIPSLEMEKVSSDMKNVVNPFVLSSSQMQRLAADGFVVSPGTEKEFFMLYEEARYRNVPIFVTSDSLLHTYHLLFDKVLRTAEVEYFIPLLRDLNRGMLQQTDANYQLLRTTEWEDAARRTVAFVAVAGRLLDPSFEVPDYARDLVEGELANIAAASGMAPSPIFPGLEFGEDYTQYIPRGHYTLSEALTAYFKSMMWYGRMTFRVDPELGEISRAETRSALLLVHALRNALLPLVTAIGLQLGFLLGGSVITESIFAWPGVGRLIVEAIYNKDFAVVQAGVTILATAFTLVNLGIDLMYAWLDPRIRYS